MKQTFSIYQSMFLIDDTYNTRTQSLYLYETKRFKMLMLLCSFSTDILLYYSLYIKYYQIPERVVKTVPYRSGREIANLNE
jgi:hypothetical protein